MYRLSRLLFVTLLSYSCYVLAEPGETWEVTSKTDMPGIPAEMATTTMTVCQPKAGSPDPQQMMQQDNHCKVSDVKTSGNKTSWKVRCKGDGQDMSGSGEITSGKSSYQGSMQMKGTVDGEKVDMKASYSGKRIGQSCDTSAPLANNKGMEDMNEMMGMAKAQMAASMAEQCEVSRYEATQLMSNQFFGPQAVCAKNQKYACKVISKDVMKKPEVYIALMKHDDTSDTSIADACKIDMKAATKAVCVKVDESNYEDLEEACPTESAKIAATLSSGRSYTSASRSEENVTDSPVSNVIDGAKKLKGLFGF